MAHSPTVRLRRLARELRRLREKSGMTLEEVGDQLGWSRAKASRIETGRVRAHHGDVADLLDLYGVAGPERDALITLARQARQRGWWAAYSDVFASSYVGLEDEAAEIRTWQSQLIHGLLQTQDYARAVIRAGRPDLDDVEIDRRVAARMTRQAILYRDPPLRLHAVFDEAVVRRRTGGAATMRAQLRVLLAAMERPNVTVQLVAYNAEPHPGLDGPFTLLSYADELDVDVVYVEGVMGAVYLESAEEIARQNMKFDRIRAAALSPTRSAELISTVVKE